MLKFTDTYTRYKQIEGEFIKWLKTASSSKNNKGGNAKWTTLSLKKAVNFIKDKAVYVPQHVFERLNEAINLRHETRKRLESKGQTADEGHEFYVQLLEQTRAMLAPLVQGGTNSATSPAVVAAVSVSSIFSSNSVPPVSTSTPAPASSEFMSNRFQTLSVDVSPAEEDDRFVIDDEDDQDGTAKSTLPKNEQALYSLELDDEIYRVHCLFFDMEELMQNIVSAWQDFKVKKISLITATAVTNSCIHILERLAGDLEMEYNHLGDIDSLICTLYFQHEIRLIVCQFGLSYHKALDLLVRSIAAHTPRLHEGFIKHIMKSAKVNEENAADIFMLCVQSYFNKVESFLNWSQLLGNDNNIQITHNFIVKMRDIYNPKRALIYKKGVFGPSWHESKNPATSTKEFFQDFLGGNFFPVLLIMPHLWKTFVTMESEDELIPIFRMTKEFCKNAKVAVNYSFSLHAMLNAVIAVQGNMDVTRLGTISGVLVNQIYKKTKEISLDPRWETWPSKANLNGILLWEEFYNNPLFLDNLNLIISQSQYDASQLTEEPKITPDTQRKALFNPWMAGQMVSMFCLGTSFAVGIGAIDSNSQCRLVLHLYNALRVKGLISELPLLETLIDLFSKTKSLWVGGRPTARGGFAKAFLLAFGYNIKWAGELAQTFAQEDFPKKYYSRNPEAKELTPAYPEDMLKTYRIMVKRDFKDVVRETDSSVVSTGYSDVMQEIKKVVEEEKNVYSLNLIELGRVFLNIKDSLLVELDMKKHVQGMVSFVLDSSTTPVSVNERLHTVVNAEVWFLQQILGWCDRSEGKSESTKERINKAAALIEGTIKGLKDSDIRLNLP